MWQALVYVLIASSSIAEPAYAQASSTESRDSSIQIVEQQADEWLEAHRVPSVSIAVIDGAKVAWTGTFGQQSQDRAATNDTLYNVASLAKPITAELFLRLAQSGEIQLDEPLWSYWIDPEISNDPRHKWLTPRLALSHQTGFPNWRYEQTGGALDILWNPGTRFGYSGEGYRYAARAAENKFGLSFEKLANERLFRPLSLNNISYVYERRFENRIALPFGPDGEYGDVPRHSEWNAAGDILSTSSDYARFIIAVMTNEGLEHQVAARRYVIDHPGERTACEKAYEACLVEEESGYALGWGVLRYEHETIVMHRGGDWGVRSLAYFIPETGFGIVVLTNGSNGEAVIRDVVEAFHTNDHWLDILHR